VLLSGVATHLAVKITKEIATAADSWAGWPWVTYLAATGLMTA
jgi:hypothetical protein